MTLGNAVIYTANHLDYGVELWRSDGTSSGTYLLSDIRLGGRTSSIANLTVVGNQVFFAAYTKEYGAELWATDGTSSGTRLVRDIYSSSILSSAGFTAGSDSTPTSLVNLNGLLMFSASTPSGNNLWRSDGTSLARH